MPKKVRGNVSSHVDTNRLSYEVTSHIDKAVSGALERLRDRCLELKDVSKAVVTSITEAQIDPSLVTTQEVRTGGIKAGMAEIESLAVDYIDGPVKINGSLLAGRLVSYSSNFVIAIIKKLQTRKITGILARLSYIKSKAIIAKSARVDRLDVTGEAVIGNTTVCSSGIDAGTVVSHRISSKIGNISTVISSEISAMNGGIKNLDSEIVRATKLTSGKIDAESIGTQGIKATHVNTYELNATTIYGRWADAIRGEIGSNVREISALNNRLNDAMGLLSASNDRLFSANALIDRLTMRIDLLEKRLETKADRDCPIVKMNTLEQASKMDDGGVAIVDGKIVVKHGAKLADPESVADITRREVSGKDISNGVLVKTKRSGLDTSSVVVLDMKRRYSFVANLVVECLDEGVRVRVPNADSSYLVVITGA